MRAAEPESSSEALNEVKRLGQSERRSREHSEESSAARYLESEPATGILTV
ncbi:hypothetical protein [Haloarcula salinisoli]|uniref:hypothetical protein n=1 Tax=Haloarcula salinisoli TaxID=2487746 RepID=UPI001C73DDE4|nr:hypothetical protein [Halomicroarcula salinisoli]